MIYLQKRPTGTLAGRTLKHFEIKFLSAALMSNLLAFVFVVIVL